MKYFALLTPFLFLFASTLEARVLKVPTHAVGGLRLAPVSRAAFTNEIDLQLALWGALPSAPSLSIFPYRKHTHYSPLQLPAAQAVLEKAFHPRVASQGRYLATDAIASALGDPESRIPKLAKVLRDSNIDGKGAKRADALERLGARIVMMPKAERNKFSRSLAELRRTMMEGGLRAQSAEVEQALASLFEGNVGRESLPNPVQPRRRKRRVSTPEKGFPAVRIAQYFSDSEMRTIQRYLHAIKEHRGEAYSYRNKRPLLGDMVLQRGTDGRYRLKPGSDSQWTQNTAKISDALIGDLRNAALRTILRFLNRDLKDHPEIAGTLGDTIKFGWGFQRNWAGPKAGDYFNLHNDGPETEVIGSVQVSQPLYNGAGYRLKYLGGSGVNHLPPQAYNEGLAFAQQETMHGFSRMKPYGRRGVWRYAYLFSLSNDLEFGFE